MENQDLLPGVGSEVVSTSRLGTHVLTSGQEDGIPVLFVHGNASSSRFFEETLAALPPGYRGLAPDLRGYGGSETRPLDATRGLRDFSDDLHDLVSTLDLGPLHLVGWSAGGSVAMQFTMDHASTVASLAGLRRLRRRDGQPRVREPSRGERQVGLGPQLARNVMNGFYFKPPFRA